MKRDASRAWRPYGPIVRALLLLAAIAAWIVGATRAITGHLHWSVTWAGLGLAVSVVGVVAGLLYLVRINHQRGPWRIFLIILLPALAGIATVMSPAVARTTWTVMLFAVGVALVWFIAAEFSGTFLRCALVAFLVVMVLLVTLIGRDALAEQRLVAARAKATSLDVELAAMSARASKARATAVDAATKAVDDLEAAGSSMPADVSTQVRAVVARFRSAIGGGPLGTLMSPAPDVGALFTTANAAVKAVPAPLEGSAAQRAVRKLCVGAGGLLRRREGEARDALPKDTAARCRDADSAVVGARELDLRSAQAERLVADLDAANSPTVAAASTKRAEAALTALDEATSNRSESPPQVSIVSAISAGGNALISWIPGVGSAPIDLELQAAGWVVLGIVAIYFARAMAWRSEDRNVGPVRVSTDELEEKDASLFSVQLINNVPEQPTIPGTTVTDPVTDLVAAAADGVTGIGKALTALAALFRPTARFEVQVSLVGPDEAPAGGSVGAAAGDGSKAASAAAPPEPAKPAPGADLSVPSAAQEEWDTDRMYQCVVRVIDVRSDKTLTVVESCSFDRRKALWRTAYAAAGWILRRSDVVPSWASWDRGASFAIADWRREDARAAVLRQHDLAALTPEQRASWAERRAKQNEKTLVALRAASAADARSGTIANALVEAIDGSSADAVLERVTRSARIAVVHPRFAQSRYAVAAWLVVIAGQPDLWWDAPPGARENCVYVLSRLRSAAGLREDADPTKLLDPSEDWKKHADRLAAEHLRDLVDLCSRSRMLLNALRRDERTYWVPRATKKSVVRSTAAALRYFVCVRAGQEPTSPNLDQYADWALALVNLACADLLPDRPGGADPRLAVEVLQDARDAYGGTYLRRSRIKGDPDLKSLSGDPRFEAFLESLVE